MKAFKFLFPLALLAFFIWKQTPLLLNSFRQEGRIIESKSYPLLQEEGIAEFAPKNAKAIAVFWASWCAPCKIEMHRLKNSVENGEIPKGSVFAINPFEDDQEIKKFLAQHYYPFTFIDAKDLALKLNIYSTPTTLFIENGKITSMNTGLSLIGIWRAEQFL